MVRFLIQRPIAVLLSFIGLLAFSLLAIRELPISLLPSIEVPSVIIKVDYPNNPARIIENEVLNPIRNELNTLNGLSTLESIASSESGSIALNFDYGTRMSLTYIEINEKIDRLLETLPRDMDRPRVIRLNTADIPIVRIQVIPKPEADYLEISELTEKVLKKRIEQLPGISMVDINGKRSQFISITPNNSQLTALGISETQLSQAITAANQELGQLNIKDGQYRYFVKMANRLTDLEEIKRLPIRNAGGDIIPLNRVAQVKFEQTEPQSYHLYNGREGLVVAVHKQAKAQMTELIPQIEEAVDLFKSDYPQADFYLSQDQSALLNAGINNLSTSLLYGGIFAFSVLFLFMGNFRLPLVMGITLPVSLLLSFLLFKATGLSINIISLSGLALGLGMLIDNAIIVIDNISRKRKEGLTLLESCIGGVNEVMTPLISSVLTTLAVFVPLVFLNGLSGALFYDQALSISIILGTSLLVAFTLLPLLYKLFFNKKEGPIKQDTQFYRAILTGYKWIFNNVWRFKGISFTLLLLLIPLCLWYLQKLPTAGLPEIEKTESMVKINWNAPIDVAQNNARISKLIATLNIEGDTEADVGISQFLLAADDSQVGSASLYVNYPDQVAKAANDQRISKYLSNQYPNATFEIKDAENAFDQIFNNESVLLSAKLADLNTGELIPKTKAETVAREMNALSNETAKTGLGFIYDQSIEALIDQQALASYGVPLGAFKQQLSSILDGELVTEINRFGQVTPIRIERNTEDFRQRLQSTFIEGTNRQRYSMSQFISFVFVDAEKHITADATGVYQAIEWTALPEVVEPDLVERIQQVAFDNGLNVRFGGDYFIQKENLKQLLFILAISVALLYFILAAQFESIVQPLIVILTLPLGILGALVIIDLSGSTLNVMSAIGIIVMLGIMVNDAILKIDTINRLSLSFNTEGSKREAMKAAIFKTSEIRLKPILMTSITTILALLPVVFASGIGADLQNPLVFAVIGGLSIGTFTALFFVPLAYWFLVKK